MTASPRPRPSRSRRGAPRVFLGLQEIAGYYSGLRDGFARIGVDATFVTKVPTRFQYGGGDVRWLSGLIARAADGCSRSLRSRLMWKPIHTASLMGLFVWAIVRHDVFVMGYGSTFFNYRELPLLKWLGKRLVYVYHGTDTRPYFASGKYDFEATKALEDLRAQKRRIEVMDRYADVIVEQPSAAAFHERPVVIFLAIGLPIHPAARLAAERHSSTESQQRSDHPIRVLHAPSQICKGTPEIREAVRRLQERGVRFEYVEVSGVPNATVLEEIARADFVIDQGFSDTPMAGFASEAALQGKPAVIGGYYGKWMRDEIPAGMIPPSEFVRPEELEQAIERLVVDAEYRRDLGQRARRYVLEHWTSEQVARKFLQLFDGAIPEPWMFDPGETRYPYGLGLTTEQVRQRVAAVVKLGGPQALMLEDKPELRAIYLDMIGDETVAPVEFTER